MNQLREWTGKCQHCFEACEKYTMSMFDVSLICLKCCEDEKILSRLKPKNKNNDEKKLES
jgi:hypothetical protein